MADQQQQPGNNTNTTAEAATASTELPSTSAPLVTAASDQQQQQQSATTAITGTTVDKAKTEMLADEDPLLISQSLTYVTDDGSILHSFQSAPFSTGMCVNVAFFFVDCRRLYSGLGTMKIQE